MLTLVLGGARSGKSRYARTLCGDASVRFVATAPRSSDPEMVRRIERHRAERPAHWKTIEAPIDVAQAVQAIGDECVLVDCVTLWLSNLSYRHRSLHADAREKRILSEVARFVDAARSSPGDVIVVSNDLGAGVVPEGALAREFRDVQGLVNQKLAEAADRVVWMVAGLATTLKS